MIKKAAVIGAGTMGAGIAAHLANAGVPCLLLDILPADLPRGQGDDPRARSRLAIDAMRRMGTGHPSGFMTPADEVLVTAGNIEDDLERIADCDWVIEAVTENLEIKRNLYEKIARHRRPHCIVSSNTSGLALSLLTEGFDESFRRHFLITHFFNPPRFMHLLEIVPGKDTLPGLVALVERFCDLRLGKGVVRAKDTANFIGNRIGVYVMGIGAQLMVEEGLSIEEVDAITGPAMGRPRTASFQLQDLVGVDISVVVMENSKRLLPDDESLARFEVPGVLRRMVEEGRLGRKSGAGFYKKVGKNILVLDVDTFDYRVPAEVSFASLQAAKAAGSAGERIRTLINGDDKAARYAWRLLSETLLYTARRIPEIADDIVSVDRALRWGFNWELGPFETWDAIGVEESVERMKADGQQIPPLVERLLESGHDSFYGLIEDPGGVRRSYFDLSTASFRVVPSLPGVLDLDAVRERCSALWSTDDASIWDLGDGVLGVELHSKMNAISRETLETISESIDIAEGGDYAGVVLTGRGPNFSVGANLKLVGAAVEAGKWDEVEAMIRLFHRTALRMRYAHRPVVTATHGMALGGGCELALAAGRVQAAAESSIGLVELGVGVIPAGGGTRELACRAHERAPGDLPTSVFQFLRESFDTVANAKTSTSAEHARALGFLRDVDAISMNADRTLNDAKARVLSLAERGYRPPRPRHAVRVAGRPGWAEFKVLLRQYQAGGFISDYDVHLGDRFAYALCGGDIDQENTVSEEYLLDLERQVFMSLLGEEKTQARIAHMLKTGKPLRN